MKTIPNTDVLDSSFVEEALNHEGPWVSIFLPTHRTGRETMAALPQYQNLLKLAERALGEAGHGDRADELLEPARALLVDNRDFWRNQSDGLAVYAAPGLLRVFRLPIELPDEVAVGDAPRLRPLAMLLAQTNSFYVLALSPNAVRLFEATQSTIGELDLGEDTPASAEEVFTDRDHQTHLQHSPQSRGGDQANFHGHGGDDNAEEINVERFFRRVADAVGKVIDRTVVHPIVLATAEGNQSLYRSVSKHKHLLEDFVQGNPERLSPEELHAQAWPLAEKVLTADETELIERFGALKGTGKASDDLTLVGRAAAEGRVESLLLRARVSRPDGQADVVQDETDPVIADTLRNGGTVRVVEDDQAPEVRAIFRY
ncbi:hypothetical protein [Tessaracoccus flavus]|nr:hypothetical protein [Tessaracoccus flavus]